MNNSTRKFLLYALSIGALKFYPDGKFLKSGRRSPYFFNAGSFNTGQSIEKLADWYAEAIVRFIREHLKNASDDKRPVLFGPAYKGISLASGAAHALWEMNKEDVGYAYNRKERKDHGEGGNIVGHPLRGHPVIIVDDVITSGTSSGGAVETIRLYEGVPVSFCIAFDRQERGAESEYSAVQEFQHKYNIPVITIATLADLLELFEIGDLPFPREEIQTWLTQLAEYKQEYGVK